MAVKPQQHTINEIYRLLIVGLGCVALALALLVGGFWLRERASENERNDRRENICGAVEALAGGQKALIAGNEAFLESIFSPGEDTPPAEAAEIRAAIEEGRRQYHALIDPSLDVIRPALEDCGTTK